MTTSPPQPSRSPRNSGLLCLPFLCIVVLVVLMAIATYIEHHYGTALAMRYVYKAHYFQILWAVAAIAGCWQLWQRKGYRRPAFFAIHIALVLILLGAACTHFFGREGQIHLRKGIPTSAMLTPSRQVEHLPFKLRLLRFEQRNYPGTTAPADYISHLLIEGERHRVSMNAVLNIENFRFFQSSFDSDHLGTVLSVNYDPWGTRLSYAGYCLLFVAMLGDLLLPKGGFRRLLRHRAWRYNLLWLLLLLPSTKASAQEVLTVEHDIASRMSRIQLCYADRICPLNTLALDFCRKIYGKSHFHQLSAEQFMLSNLHFPHAWNEVPMILIKNSQLRQRLGITRSHASLAQLYDGKTYRLQSLLQSQKNTDSELVRAIQATDEQVGLLLMLRKGTLIRPLAANDVNRLSDTKIEAELFYNRFPPILVFAIVNLLLSAVSIALLTLFRQQRWQALLLRLVMGLSLLLMLLLFALRWYLGGHAPMSNGFETMFFLAIAAQAISWCCAGRFAFSLPFGFLLAGFSLLVAHLAEMSPQLTPLQPVLASSLLCVHVALCMVAYALFAFSAFNSGYTLLLVWKNRRAFRLQRAQKVVLLTQLNRLMLLPAVYLLFAGIFVGAIWANQSWGRYWAWDPKEVWALITALVYALALYPTEIPFLRRKVGFHLYLLLAFWGVVFTYFGVNFLLGGMHSYA